MFKDQLPKIVKNKLQKSINSPVRIHSYKKYKCILRSKNIFEKRNQNENSSLSHFKQRQSRRNQIILEDIPTKVLFGNVQYPEKDLDEYLRQLHQSIIYSSFVLGSPSGHDLKQKMVNFPQSEDDKKQKILLVDLEQTLIYAVQKNQQFQVQLDSSGQKIKLNIRPFCFQFLESMSEYFQIYIFTSYCQQYAKPIVEHLNSNKKYIKGVLTRQKCFQTRSGVVVKDLRIIQNRDLSQMVIVDSVAHCFGLQIDNGIPIIPFKNRKSDRELLGLQKLLLQLKDVGDVRSFLSSKLQLKKCCQMSENDFVRSIKWKNMNLKKRTCLY